MDGVVTIVSEDGYVRWRSGKIEQSISLPFSIKGTLISITVHTEPGKKLVYRSEMSQS
jgi:hypothetical protein